MLRIFFEPVLSGSDWKAKELGERVVRLLVKIIEGREKMISGRTLTTDFIVRNSCGIKR